MTQANILLPPSAQTLRDLGDALSPTYLSGPVFKAYRYAINVVLDATIDSAAYAVRARFPQLAPPDARSWLAQDRQVFQGPGESGPGYVARLIQWLDLARLIGSPTAVLLAYLADLTPLAPQVQTVTSWAGTSPGTVWQTYAAGATPFPPGQSIPTPPALLTVQSANWDWDGASQPFYFPWMRWRTWVIIQSSGPEAPWPAPTKTWGSGGTFSLTVVSDATYGSVYTNGGTPASSSATSFDWGDGTCWGWAGTAQQAEQLTALAKTYKSAGTWIPWIIVCYDPTWFQPTSSNPGTDSPDGTWGYYSKIVSDATYGSRSVPSRPSASTCTLICGTADGQRSQPLGVG